jgi:uncharacterized membrane protein YccC
VKTLEWLRAHDPQLAALRRSGRAAIVMPVLFVINSVVIGNGTLALFGAFGSMAMLLFVDHSGPMRDRVFTQAGLTLAGAVLITIGTLLAPNVWLAALGTLLVTFIVQFVGVVSSVLASATTALLVSFILPVTLPGPLSSLPERAGGWLIAGAVSIVAIVVLWPVPTKEALRGPAARACVAIARRLRAEVDCFHGGDGGDLDALTKDASEAVAVLRKTFFSTPYRPTGVTTAARTLVRLVDEIVWLDSVLDQQTDESTAAVCEVKLAAASLLEHGGNLLDSDEPDLGPDLERLKAAREAMENTVTSGSDELEPSFRAQEMSFAIAAIGRNIQLTVAARRRTWWQRLIGAEPRGLLESVQERAGAHVDWRSVWLHNSTRGAVAIAVAVVVSELSGVEHSFWVVLGSLGVLRSSALSTGQNILRALLGTTAGIIVGSLLGLVIGTNTTVFWILLPFAILFTGLAPAAISFAAGQAAFSITILVLFNIIAPAGLSLGLVRFEDVAIGSAVSLVVGFLFWPRGAAPALGQAVAAALSESTHYLRSAVEYGVSRCDAVIPSTDSPEEQNARAAAAARRLDDAFRGYLAERGTKHIPLAEVTTLVTTVAILRLTAEAVLDLWRRDHGSPTGDRSAARTELLDAAADLVDWYEQAALALAGAGTVPDPQPRDGTATARLTEAVRRDLDGKDAQSTATAVKMIWTADHLDVARRLQTALAGPAKAAVAARERYSLLRT